MHKLLEHLKDFGSPRIALVGDFMLDRYLYGNAERISPEAPVPVLKIVREEMRLGGAGSAAAALTALGAKAACVGVRGGDDAGEDLGRLLHEAGAEVSALVKLENRPTTVKVRHVGLAQHRHAQQMLRVDRESNEALANDVQATLRAAVKNETRKCKVVALEDYGKGVFNDTNTSEIISDARQAGCIVVVDPTGIENYSRYRGASVLTPNRSEAELASGITICDEESLERAARQILLAADAEAVVITMDKEGAYLLCREGGGRRILTRPRTVYDVSGAGDEVLAALSLGLAEGLDYDLAVTLANVAGGLEVERFGVVPIRREEVADEIRRMIGIRGSKLLDRAQLAQEIERRHAQGDTVIFTNGCFDLLHLGHLRMLRQARELGSCLVVAINSDESIRNLKGPTRPIIGEEERGEMLGALECVDYVTIFDDDTARPLLELLRPEVFVKGGSTPVMVEGDTVESYGGRVCKLDLMDGLSTTSIIERVLANHDQSAREPKRKN